MPARSITWATARWPISRYGVCSRCNSASIIEFSKWVRRHRVTKELGLPVHPFAFRNGVAIATSPPCMSTTVPYWSNMQALTLFLMALTSTAHSLFAGWLGSCPKNALWEGEPHRFSGVIVHEANCLLSPARDRRVHGG